MRTTDCADCGISDRLHEEIGAALAEAAPDPEVRDDLAREALARSPSVASSPRRSGRLVLLAAVAACLSGALFVLLPAGPADDPAPVSAAAVAKAREANAEALGSEAVRARLAAAPQGSYAMIAEGRLVGIYSDFGRLLFAAQDAAASAPHRYVFRVGTEGDKAYRTITPVKSAVGMAFLRDAGLEFWEDPKKVEGLFKYDGTRLTARLRVGGIDGIHIPTEAEWEEAARPGGSLPTEKSAPAPEEIEIPVVTGFDGPLLLPEGFPVESSARWEIPGIATIGGGAGRNPAHRRVNVYVQIDGPVSRSLIAEALVPVAAPDPKNRAIEVEWVRVPAGPFLFGPRGTANEYSLEAFEIMKHEVTNAEWWAYLKSEEKRLRGKGKFEASVPPHWGWDPDSSAFPAPPGDLMRKPVTRITWYQAYDFCREWLGSGAAGARLPFAYEWVKAARGPTDDRPYPWGTEFFDLRSGLRIPRANVRATGLIQPMDVGAWGKTDVSPYGVVGMGGNVSEFVDFGRFRADWPQPGFMGGSYIDEPDEALLNEGMQLARGSDHRWSFVGFRAARFVSE